MTPLQLKAQLDQRMQQITAQVDAQHEEAIQAARRLTNALQALGPKEKEQALKAMYRTERYAIYTWMSGLIVMTSIAVACFVAAISPGAAVVLGAMTIGLSLPLPWALGQAFRKQFHEEKLMARIQGEAASCQDEMPQAVASLSEKEAIVAVQQAQRALTETIQQLAHAERLLKKMETLANQARAKLQLATQAIAAGQVQVAEEATYSAERLLHRIGTMASQARLEEPKKPISNWFIMFSALSLIPFVILAGLVVGSPAAPVLVPVCLAVGLGVRAFLFCAVLYENYRETLTQQPVSTESTPLSTHARVLGQGLTAQNRVCHDKKPSPQGRPSADKPQNPDPGPGRDNSVPDTAAAHHYPSNIIPRKHLSRRLAPFRMGDIFKFIDYLERPWP